jgi:N-acetylglucosaminyldiphosphoundecaprenol N-acetyl-beta-D-mannosaminyltransferase
MVHFVHAHALTVAGDDVELRRHYAAADWVLPDGVGLRIAAAMLGRRLRANVNGTDLFAPLLDALAPRRARLALIGGAPGVAGACADRIRARQPSLDVALVANGYLDAGAIEELRRRLRALAPCVVLVGMGTPIQEHWAWLHLADLAGLTVLTVGGLFDFHAGRVRRAPPAWREAGLEWLYRLGQEPRRLARRNLIGHPRFLARVAAQRVRAAGR